MFIVDKEKCIACKQCINDCPVNDIILKDNKAHVKNESCIKCGHCVAICPTKAVSTNDYDMDDVIEYNKESFTVDADNLLNFIKFRRSIRNFKNKKIEKEKIEAIFTSSNSGLIQNLADNGLEIDGMTKIAIIESSVGIATLVVFIAIYLGIIFLIASSAILALKQLTESSDNRQRYIILRKIGCDEKMINQALFRQIGIFFILPLILAIIHSIFGIQFALSMMSALASTDQLLPSAIATVVIIGVIYGMYFLATYWGSKNIIKEEQ